MRGGAEEIVKVQGNAKEDGCMQQMEIEEIVEQIIKRLRSM